MADEKTYSENEHLAILADRVTRETADVTAERDQLKTERDELATQLDVAESGRQAAETAKAELQSEFESFKAGIEAEREAAAKKDVRVAKAREAAKHLDDKFFEDEARIARIVAMSDDAFEGYVTDLASTATGTTTTSNVPRETAMHGSKVGGDAPTAGAGRSFLLRQFVAPESKGA